MSETYSLLELFYAGAKVTIGATAALGGPFIKLWPRATLNERGTRSDWRLCNTAWTAYKAGSEILADSSAIRLALNDAEQLWRSLGVAIAEARKHE